MNPVRKSPLEVRFTVAADDPLWDQLAARSGIGYPLACHVPGAIGSYFSLLADELAEMRLSEDEAVLLMGALRRRCFHHAPHNTLLDDFAAGLEDEETLRIRDVGFETAVGLLQRLSRITPGQALAIADALERFWTGTERWGPAPEFPYDRLRPMGLVQDD